MGRRFLEGTLKYVRKQWLMFYGRLGVDLSSANAHYVLGGPMHPPCPRVWCALGLGLGLGFEKFENINHCCRPKP